jgi:micrococcal nuclease
VLCVVVVAWVWIASRPVPGATTSPTAVAGKEPPGATAATGIRVIDGDTLDVRLDGRTVRVRMLNVDAPETAHDAQPAQCLAAEATKWLAGKAGKGTPLLLVTYGTDRFGRTLAGVYDKDNRLLNADAVGAGLAAPFVVNRQVDLIAPVRAAQQDAARAGAGLHAATGCTVPGRLAALEQKLDALPMKVADRAAAARELARADSVRAGLDALATDLAGKERNALVDGLTDGEMAGLKDRLAAARARLTAITIALRAQA